MERTVACETAPCVASATASQVRAGLGLQRACLRTVAAAADLCDEGCRVKVGGRGRETMRRQFAHVNADVCLSSPHHHGTIRPPCVQARAGRGPVPAVPDHRADAADSAMAPDVRMELTGARNGLQETVGGGAREARRLRVR